MTKINFITSLFVAIAIYVNGQSNIKGHLIDEYGNDGWAEVYLNGEPTKWMDYDGIINLKTSKKGLNEITFRYFGHFITKIKFECVNEVVDLGNIYLISDHFWFDGPKNGIITEKYDSGKTKYLIPIKKWKIHGSAEYYNRNGELTQKLSFKKGKLQNILVRENDSMIEIDFEISKNGEILTVPNIG